MEMTYSPESPPATRAMFFFFIKLIWVEAGKLTKKNVKFFRVNQNINHKKSRYQDTSLNDTMVFAMQKILLLREQAGFKANHEEYLAVYIQQAFSSAIDNCRISYDYTIMGCVKVA